MSKKYNVILADWPSANKAGRALKGYKVVDGKQINPITPAFHSRSSNISAFLC